MDRDDLTSRSISTNKKRFRWAILILLCLTIPIFTFLLVGKVNNKPPVVDRHNPESILRAYFDAWSRNDWHQQKSYMNKIFNNMTPEPVESVHLEKVQRLKEVSPTRVVYHVIFNIKVRGHGLSMATGRYDWTYELTWNKDENSWLITNYGAC